MFIRNFIKEDINQLYELFLFNYNNTKSKYIGLPNDKEWNESIFNKLEAMTSKNPCVVAIDNEKVIGYLSGYFVNNLKGNKNGIYTPLWAHATLEKDKVKIYHYMFSNIWSSWRDLNIYTHCMSYFENQVELQRYLFNMAYGSIVEDGIKPLIDNTPISFSNDIIIREITQKDLEVLLKFDNLLIDYLNEEPTFRYGEKSTEKEIKNDFFIKPGICFVAEINGCIVGSIRGHFGQTTNSLLVCTPTNIAIDHIYVKEDYRKTGIGLLLLKSLEEEAFKKGMKTCSVDFETHNYLACSFWQKYFQIFNKSVIRKIDDRF